MIRLRLIISGGETGADLTGLEEAHKLGIPTGGFCYNGYDNELGECLDLRDLYGLRETGGNRTELNAAVGDVTVWFGFPLRKTGGGMNTLYGCKRWHRPIFSNPTPAVLQRIIEIFEVVNIAGNRESINPPVVQMVRDAFAVWRVQIEDATREGTYHGQGQSREVRTHQSVDHSRTHRTQPNGSLYRAGAVSTRDEAVAPRSWDDIEKEVQELIYSQPNAPRRLGAKR